MPQESKQSSGKLVLLHGLPGSGKSTYTQSYVDSHAPGEVVVVNRDSIREQLFGFDYHFRTPNKKAEQQVTQVHHQIVRDGLESGKTVVDDNTNLNVHTLNSIAQNC